MTLRSLESLALRRAGEELGLLSGLAKQMAMHFGLAAWGGSRKAFRWGPRKPLPFVRQPGSNLFPIFRGYTLLRFDTSGKQVSGVVLMCSNLSAKP